MDRNRIVTDKETLLPEGEMIYSVTNLKGVIQEANDVFARISDYAVEDLIGRPHNIVRHPDMPKEAFEDMWRDIKAGRNWRGVVKNLRKDGGYYWVIANVSPVMRDGKCVGYQSVRTAPSRDEVAAVSAAYKRIVAGDQSLYIEHGAIRHRLGLLGGLLATVQHALLGVWAPLSRSLSFFQKFVLIFLVSMIPCVVLLLDSFAASERQITQARIELGGAKYIAAYGAVGNAIAQHRGTSSLVLAGDTSYRAKVTDAEQAADTALAAAKQSSTYMLSNSAASQLDKITHDWNELKGGWASGNVAVNIAKHNLLLSENADFIYSVAGDSGLLLDSDPAAYYQAVLVTADLPQLRTTTGLLRSLIASTAASGGTNSVMLNMAENIASRDLPTLAQHVALNFRLVAAHDPASGPELQAQWQQVAASIDGLQTALSEKVFVPSKAEGGAQQYNDQIKPVLDGIEHVHKVVADHLAQAISARIEADRKENIIRGLVSLGVVAVAAWLIASFAADITLRTEALKRRSEQLACGNFTQLEEIAGRDELVAIAHSGDLLARRLNKIFAGLNGSVNDLLHAAHTIAAASEQVAHSSNEQNSSIEAMAAAIEEMTVAISHMSNNATNAHQLTSDSGATANEGCEVISQVVAKISSIAETVRSASNTVDELGKQVDEISGIISVIKEIADQTNLLALNAAIEAARAGESGRGFAVVADEVRKLAERTTASTGQISSMIARIQSGTASVVQSMQAGVTQVEQGVAITGSAGDSMNQISASSAKVIEAVYDVLNALKEQSVTAQLIARNAEAISQTCDETRASATSLAATADTLKGMADGLHQEVRVFRT